ncbi:MAG: hypothetical protein IAG13_18250, partial [Deltaproteobacteria bacterium]|nr:hypothetical protein [Nannocystaceae bacterium]
MTGRDDDDDDREHGEQDAAPSDTALPPGDLAGTDAPREPDAPRTSTTRASESHPGPDASSSGPIHSRRAVRIRSLPPPPPGDSGSMEPLELGTADEETFEIGPVVDIAALPRGTMIAGHVLLGRLGEDGLGPIYTAFDNEGSRKLALRLLPVPGDDPESVDAQLALVAELTAVSRISHPCVVAVRDVGVWSGGVYVAMDFFDGIDLSTWIEARDEPFPWREVVRV